MCSTLKRKTAVTYSIIIIALLIFSFWAYSGFKLPQLTSIPDPLGGTPSPLQGDSNVGDTSNETPQSNPQITISATPNVIERGGITTLTADSNVPYGRIHVEASYVGTPMWQSLGYFSLDSNGYMTRTGVIENFAGDFNFRATLVTSGTQSIPIQLKINGIAIYQQKDVWNVGEHYTAMLSGTYKNWMIYYYVKDVSATEWTLLGADQTNPMGLMMYGEYYYQIKYEHAGTTKQFLAVTSLSDPSGQNVASIIAQPHPENQQEYLPVPTSVIDDLVNSGQIIKSNLLTTYVNS